VRQASATHSAQHERLEHGVQLLDDVVGGRLVHDVEPGVEAGRRGEHLRHQEVEQRPQLVQIVLQWRAYKESNKECT
jgi:hypothetical protein